MFGSPLLYGDVAYRLQQADGSVTFSDTAIEGSQGVELKQVPTMKLETETSGNSGSTATAQEKVQKGEQTAVAIELLSPADQETIWHDDNGLEVTVAVKPALPQLARVAIILDGEEVATATSEVINIGIVFRGSHQISARLLSNSGRVIAETPTITFHLRQHSLIKPLYLREEQQKEE